MALGFCGNHDSHPYSFGKGRIRENTSGRQYPVFTGAYQISSERFKNPGVHSVAAPLSGHPAGGISFVKTGMEEPIRKH